LIRGLSAFHKRQRKRSLLQIRRKLVQTSRSAYEGAAAAKHPQQAVGSTASRHVVLEPSLRSFRRIGPSHRIELPGKVNHQIGRITPTGYVQLVVDHAVAEPARWMRERYCPRQVCPRVGHRIV